MMKLFARRERPTPSEPASPADAPARALSRLKSLVAHRPPPQAGGIKTAIRDSLLVLQTTLAVIDRLRAALEDLRDTVAAATEAADAEALSLLAARYEELWREIGAAVAGAAAHGVNLLDGTRKPIEIAVGGLGHGAIAIRPIDLTPESGGLNLAPPEQAFASGEALLETAERVIAAGERLNRAAQVFVADAAMLAAIYQSMPGKVAPPAATPD